MRGIHIYGRGFVSAGSVLLSEKYKWKVKECYEASIKLPLANVKDQNPHIQKRQIEYMDGSPKLKCVAYHHNKTERMHHIYMVSLNVQLELLIQFLVSLDYNI